MTVKELIEELKKFPSDADVVRGDMEYGPFPVTTVRWDGQDVLIGVESD